MTETILTVTKLQERHRKNMVTYAFHQISAVLLMLVKSNSLIAEHSLLKLSIYYNVSQ